MICQIMRIPLFFILNSLIVVVMIFLLIHLIMILIFPLLVFLSQRPLMIYLLMIWNFYKLSRHFSTSKWLFQVLVVLRSVPIPIRTLIYLSRPLITPPHILKIILYHNFFILHFHCTILSLSYWRSHTWRARLQNESFLLSLCSPSFVV